MTKNTLKILRWITRIWSLVILTFFLLITIGEFLSPHTQVPITLVDIGMLLLFPGATCIGLIMAWRWEGLGGLISLSSVILFTLIMAFSDRFNNPPRFLLLLGFIAAPGLLFLLHWLLTRGRGNVDPLSGNRGALSG